MALHRTLAAALVTLAALALLAAIALGAGGNEPSQPAAAPKPKVRTVVVHRTIHVRPKHSTAARPALAAPAGAMTAVSSRGADSLVRSDEFGDDRGGEHRGDDDHDDDHGGGHGSGRRGGGDD